MTMKTTSKNSMERALNEGKGVLLLEPAWVPRSFCRPGMRIKLHPDDTYALGLSRGGIDERWLSSTTHADNGPGTPADEGLSYVAAGGDSVLLCEMVECYGPALLGDALWQEYHGWPIYSKFFDNLGPLPHHIHHGNAHAARVGKRGKPEMYFFPSQMNNHPGEFPHTFFGINPETTKADMLACLAGFAKGDNRLLEMSRAFKLELDTGWDVPPGLLHAPGSLCTYEPQVASDVYAMYQSVLLGGHTVPEDLLWKDCPPEEKGSFAYLVDLMDWALNTDPNLHQNRFMRPIAVQSDAEAEALGYREEWICYKSAHVCAKRLTVLPGRQALVKDHSAHGIIAIQGHGCINGAPMETPTLIRFGTRTSDEFYVTYEAATRGVEMQNLSRQEPLVMLKHFAGGVPCL